MGKQVLWLLKWHSYTRNILQITYQSIGKSRKHHENHCFLYFNKLPLKHT